MEGLEIQTRRDNYNIIMHEMQDHMCEKMCALDHQNVEAYDTLKNDLITKIEQLQSTVALDADLNAKFGLLQTRTVKLDADLKTAMTANGALDDDLRVKIVQNDALKRSIVGLDADVANAMAAKDALTAELATAKASNDAVKTSTMALNRDLATAKAANEELKKVSVTRIETLKAELATLRGQEDKCVTDLATATTCGAKMEGYTPKTVEENPRCDLIYCRFWTCIEWCECYDQKNVALYALLGVVEDGTDSCGCK
jgi:DNA repair exonuclease SbcCD ATPase subunit